MREHRSKQRPKLLGASTRSDGRHDMAFVIHQLNTLTATRERESKI
ncbi:hypothetical protein K7574_21350 (plasmid) [Stenotrophomonas maltophilia]|nr:hypothetical protein [Stenotrophomonas maltophilia]UXF74643.1 hypothetical protein K7574_21350 [Stenotrophomonas maltophilia]